MSSVQESISYDLLLKLRHGIISRAMELGALERLNRGICITYMEEVNDDLAEVVLDILEKEGYDAEDGSIVIDGSFFYIHEDILTVLPHCFCSYLEYDSNTDGYSISITPRNSDSINALPKVSDGHKWSKIMNLEDNISDSFFDDLNIHPSPDIYRLYDNEGSPNLEYWHAGVNYKHTNIQAIASLTSKIIKRFGDRVKDVYFLPLDDDFKYAMARKYSDGEISIVVF